MVSRGKRLTEYQPQELSDSGLKCFDYVAQRKSVMFFSGTSSIGLQRTVMPLSIFF